MIIKPNHYAMAQLGLSSLPSTPDRAVEREGVAMLTNALLALVTAVEGLREAVVEGNTILGAIAVNVDSINSLDVYVREMP